MDMCSKNEEAGNRHDLSVSINEPEPIEKRQDREILLRRNGFVLARWSRGAKPEYVTWRECRSVTGLSVTYEYGHYFDSYAEVLTDFEKRAVAVPQTEVR